MAHQGRPGLRAGAEDQRPAPLGDEPLEPGPVLGRQVGRVDVADDDRLEGAQRVGLVLSDSVSRAGSDRVVGRPGRSARRRRMEDDRLDRDVRVAGQGVAEVAELPARLAVDQQDVGLVVGHLDRDRPAVVVGADVPVERPDGQRQRGRAGFLERDAERDDRARRMGVGGGPHDLLHRRGIGTLEGHGDLAAGVAVELERRLDAGHVAAVDRFRRLDRRDRRVARGGRRADQDREDRHAPRRQAVDGRRDVLRRGHVLPAVGQQDHAEHRRIARGRSERLRQRGLPVGLPAVRVVGFPGRTEFLRQGRKLAGVVEGAKATASMACSEDSRASGASGPSNRRRATSRRGREPAFSPGARRSTRASAVRSASVRPGSAVSMLRETSTATTTRPRRVSLVDARRDRLEERGHQRGRGQQAQAEQEQPGPSRDELTLGPVEDPRAGSSPAGRRAIQNQPSCEPARSSLRPPERSNVMGRAPFTTILHPILQTGNQFSIRRVFYHGNTRNTEGWRVIVALPFSCALAILSTQHLGHRSARPKTPARSHWGMEVIVVFLYSQVSIIPHRPSPWARTIRRVRKTSTQRTARAARTSMRQTSRLPAVAAAGEAGLEVFRGLGEFQGPALRQVLRLGRVERGHVGLLGVAGDRGIGEAAGRVGQREAIDAGLARVVEPRACVPSPSARTTTARARCPPGVSTDKAIDPGRRGRVEREEQRLAGRHDRRGAAAGQAVNQLVGHRHEVRVDRQGPRVGVERSGAAPRRVRGRPGCSTSHGSPVSSRAGTAAPSAAISRR